MATHLDLNLVDGATDGNARDYVELLGKFPYRPTLFLGLGGTGAQTVQKVKSLFLKYVTPQAKQQQKAGVPEIDPLYAFLAFDTNRGELPPGLAENREWRHLGVRDLRNFYEGVGKTPFFEKWLVKGYPAGSLMSGAGGFRNLGRLALIANVAEVSRAIGQAKQQIMGAAAGQKTTNPRPCVYIFCSMSGGTGSGMVLDTAFLVRAAFDDADVVGIIGVLDGLPTLPQEKRKDLRVNTFCGLKELNAFMTNSAEGYRSGDSIQYPFNVTGKVTEPFDECHLVSSHRNDGAHNLPTQAHLSSFMARSAFAMSAYSFSARELTTPDYAGVMVNHRHQLTGSRAGSRTCYVVPGLAQAHFPVETVANLFVVETAKSFLRYQGSGNAPPDNVDALAFMQLHGLDYRALQQRAGANPKDPRGGALGTRSYEDDVQRLMPNNARLRALNRDQLLGLGKKFPLSRLKEVASVFQPNIDAIVEKTWGAVYDRFSAMLASEEFRGLGALDFLDDLALLLESERANIDAADREVTAPAVAAIEREWQAIKGLVSDVATSRGIIDRLTDQFRLSRVQATYVAFLNEAEQVVMNKARQDGAKAALTSIMERISSLSASQARLVHQDIPAAVKVLETHERDLHTRLFQQTDGLDSSVENICSVNVITQEWRDAYLANQGLSAGQVLSNLLKVGWHPRNLLTTAPGAGATVGTAVAQVVVDLIEPLFDDVRAWTPLEVLKMTEEIGRQKPEAVMASMYLKQLQPQLEVGFMKSLGAECYPVVFCGGIDAELQTRLRNADEFNGITLSVADNQETHRVNFFSVTLPVALAGADLVQKPLRNEYERWAREVATLSKAERQYQESLYHCFPGSARWPLPTRYSQGTDVANERFAKAFAISEMVKPDDADRKRMLDAASNPKEQGYGLFQFGKNQFWMWPFFVPMDKSSTTLSGKPLKLGPNVLDASRSFAQDEALQEEAQKWINWFEETWSELYTAPQLEAQRTAALDTIGQRKGKTDELDRVALWDELATVIRSWEL